MNYHLIKVLGTTNTGDMCCDPFDYLPPPPRLTRHCITRPLPPFTEHDHIIFGGGGLFNYHENWNRHIIQAVQQAHTSTTWAIGFNRHYDTPPPTRIDLTTITNYTTRHHGPDFLPCPSCLNTSFDIPTTTTDPPLFVGHKETPLPNYLNSIQNNIPLALMARKMARAEAIITNTYHGAYWALLLGKRTILYKPFSTRFEGLPHNPPRADSIEAAIALIPRTEAPRSPLNLYRRLNRDFHRLILQEPKQQPPLPFKEDP